MAKRNNPAARLQAILVKGRDGKNMNKAIHLVWSELLGVEQQNRHVLLFRLGKVYQLPSQVRNAITRVDGLDHGLYLDWMPKVEKAFSVNNFDAPWQHFVNPIDDHVIHSLGICSEVLSRMRAETTVPEDELQKTRNLVAQLIDEIIKTPTINHMLSRFMLDRLMAILEAIDCYALTGAEPINEAVQAALGAVFLDRDRFREIGPCPQSNKFWALVGGLVLLLGLVNGSIELAERCSALALPAPLVQSDKPSAGSGQAAVTIIITS